MAAAPDVYAAIKEFDRKGIVSLRDDCFELLVLSTRIHYNKDNLDGRIIHYFGSTVKEPVEVDVTIPVFEAVPLEEAILTGPHAEQGLAYLQAYFGTQDSSKEIIRTLKRAAGWQKTTVWTAMDVVTPWTRYSRQMSPVRATFLSYGTLGGDCFGVDTGFSMRSYAMGCSREVSD